METSMYPFMQFSLLLLFATLLAFALFFLCVEQISVLSKAKNTGRALYKKRAQQGSQLAFSLNIIALALVGLYYKELSLAIFFGAGALAFNLFWLLGIRSANSKISVFSGFFSFLFSLSFAIYLFGSAYVQFYTNYPLTFLYEQIPATVDPFNFTQELFKIFLPYIQFTNVKIYLILSLFFTLTFAGNSIAFSLLLQNTLFSRKKDDFGRDYYSSTIKELAKNAFRTSFILCLIILVFIGLSYTKHNYFPFTLSQLSAILLLLPIATANFAILALSYNPLRHKIALVVSPLLTFTASAYFLFQSIIPLSQRVLEKL